MLKNANNNHHQGLPDFENPLRQAGTKSCLTAGRHEVVFEERPIILKSSTKNFGPSCFACPPRFPAG
jgi:hypothetical protein